MSGSVRYFEHGISLFCLLRRLCVRNIFLDSRSYSSKATSSDYGEICYSLNSYTTAAYESGDSSEEVYVMFVLRWCPDGFIGCVEREYGLE